MKIEVNEQYNLEVSELFNPIILKSEQEDLVSICQRDCGLETLGGRK